MDGLEFAASPLSKIHDAGLRQLAAEGSTQSVDVLIELDLPIPVLRVTRGLGGELARSLAPPRSGAAENAVAAFERFGGFLRGLGVSTVTPLITANAYAVRLPARTLQTVANNPLVHGVSANRRLHA